ncbi:MAG: PadR family transcriptional regulator [Anaerosomatales bacterium]|nr:PadR family transcriptional regulator [Anaerosomatales bacterium]
MRPVSRVLVIAVLATLEDAPLHAYGLKQRIDVGLGKLMPVAEGTLYPLLRGLESDGLIASETRPGEGGRPDRVVYSLTEAGVARLREMLAAPLEPGAAGTLDFYVRVPCFGRMEPSQVRALLDERRSRIHADLAALAAARARLARVSGHAELIDLRERQLHAELDWLDALARS